MNVFGIYLDQTDLWLLGVAGACLAWLIPHRLALWRERRSRRLNAAAIFRNTVKTELLGLYPSPIQWPDEGVRIVDVLEAKFPVLESAVVEFRGHLTWLDKRRFDRAWRTYHCSKNGLPYSQYVAIHGDGYADGMYYKNDTRFTYQSDFRKNVDHLLSFADET